MEFKLSILRDRRYLAILLLGFSSGLPLLLVGSTLRYWLADSGVTLTMIGIFNLVAMPYALKFLWAPVLDRAPLPFLTARLGRRRGWLLAIQALLLLSLLLLGRSHPATDLAATARIAVVVAFLSASQDVVIDALRIEMLQPAEYGLGSAVSNVGYRIGMLAAGAGALYAAEYASWAMAYVMMAALVGIGIVGAAIAPEQAIYPLPHGIGQGEGVPPNLCPTPSPDAPGSSPWASPSPMRERVFMGKRILRDAVWAPLADFTKRKRWTVILAFVLCYKLAPVLALSLTSPFYRDLGFTKAEVASISKVFGLAASLAGGFIGAWLIMRIGIWRCLLWGGICQAIALYCFWGLSQAGHSIPFLVLAILSENVTSAIAATAFVAYLSLLCNKTYTATQFALLTAMAAFTSETLTSSMGFVATSLGWHEFFALIPLTALPGLALLFWLRPTVQP